MSSFIDGTASLALLFCCVKIFIWVVTEVFRRQDEKRAREFRRVTLLAEAQAIGAAHQQRTQRNHRQFDRELWDRR